MTDVVEIVDTLAAVRGAAEDGRLGAEQCLGLAGADRPPVSPVRAPDAEAA